MKKIIILSVLLLAVLVGVVTYVIGYSRPEIIVIMPSSAPVPVIADRSIEVPDDWQTLVSEEHTFSIQHPPTIQVDRLEDGVRFFQLGPTQQEGTEVYDALALTFSSGSLMGTPLQLHAELRHEESRRNPIIESVGSIMPVVINEYPGYWYTIRSLGTFTQTYLPNGTNRYLLITDGTVDPTNQGFEEMVNMMLSTLQVGLQQL
jgi:hypothetical protein